MALSLDDKLLGEKVHNYCSSDEGTDDEDNNDYEDEDGGKTDEKRCSTYKPISPPAYQQYQGSCTNTGPKGVLNDWREYKRMENARREENEAEKLALAKKLTLTCRSYLNDEEEKEKEASEGFQLEEEFLQEYRFRRLEEMKRAMITAPRFGNLVHLNSTNYVDSIDKENTNTTVLVHVYNKSVKACEAMTGCFKCLAKDYPSIKFCEISSHDANLSTKFSFDGVPAILAYRNKQLIGNYIRLSQELGDDFYATDVESFLLEHGVLPFNDKQNLAIRDCAVLEESDSDFELD